MSSAASAGGAAALRFAYNVLGLLAHSEIELPELPDAGAAIGPADIVIRRGAVPPHPGPTEGDEDCPPYRVDETGFFLEREGVARFLVVDGRSVTVDARPDVAEVDVRVFLLGSVLGALCHQRDLIPLHAAVAGLEDDSFAFAGPSGTGKSTISAGLRQRGFSFVADDICPIVLRARQQPYVLGSVRKVKLAADTMDALGHPPGEHPRDHRTVPKYHLPVGGQSASHPLPLRGIYMFRHDEDAAPDCRIEAIPAAYAVRCFENLTYMPRYPRLAGCTEQHFLRCAALAALVPLFLVHHRRGLERLPDLLDELSNHIHSLARGSR